MANLYEILADAQQGEAIAELGREFGLTTQQTQAAVAALLPAISMGLKRSTATPEGLGNLFALMGARPDLNAMYDDPQAAFSRQGRETGDVVLSRMFGSPDASRAIADQAQQLSGVSSTILKKLLPVLAGLLISGLMRSGAGQAAPSAPQASPAGGGGLGDILRQIFGQGSPESVDPTAALHPRRLPPHPARAVGSPIWDPASGFPFRAVSLFLFPRTRAAKICPMGMYSAKFCANWRREFGKGASSRWLSDPSRSTFRDKRGPQVQANRNRPRRRHSRPDFARHTRRGGRPSATAEASSGGWCWCSGVRGSARGRSQCRAEPPRQRSRSLEPLRWRPASMMSGQDRNRSIQKVEVRRKEAFMANKQNFTPDEWTKILESTAVTGVAVTAAEPSGVWGMLKEAIAAGTVLASSKADPKSNELIKAVVADLESGEGRASAQEALKKVFAGAKPADVVPRSLEVLRQVSATLDAKAPADAPAFKAWLNTVAQKVAEASKRGLPWLRRRASK